MSKKKKQINMVLFISSLVILFISGIIFCFCGTRNLKSDATLILTYLDNTKGLEIDNTSPITDRLGRNIEFNSSDSKTGYVEFSLSANLDSNEEIHYELCVKEEELENSISSRYIKLYLTDANTDIPIVGFNKHVSTFYDLKVASSDVNSRGLYKGVLKSGEVKDFRLRMWLDDTYTINNNLEKFKINLTVSVID